MVASRSSLGRRLTGILRNTREERDRKLAADRIRFLSGLYATLSQVSRLMVRAGSGAELFQETVRICTECGGFDLAWIGVADAAGERVTVAAAHGPSLAYVRDLEVSLDPASPMGRGPCATAFREGRTCVVGEWATDPAVEPWRSKAAPFRIRTSACFPIRQAGQVVAVMTLYAQVPERFQPEWLELLDSLARELGFALDKLAEARRRVQAEEELRAGEELFRASFERAIAAKSIVTPDGRILRVNEAFRRMLGYGEGELEGVSIHAITHPDDWEATQAFIVSLQTGNAPGHRRTKAFLHKDGHVVWGDVSSGVVRGAQGAPRYFVTDIVDITQRQALEEALHELNDELEARVALRTRQLESANEDLHAFALGAAHDLRAPLRALGGVAELLLQSPALPEATRLDYLQRIHAGATGMGCILDDLLRLARIGREDLAPAPVDLAAITRDVFGRLQEAEHGRAVVLNLEASLPARGDVRLLQVLMGNLVGNAWKFTADQTPAVVEVGRAAGHGQAFYVRDNGVGFPMTRAGRIFEPFQRLHPGAAFPGTGIGLALADRVVKRHGGRIWAEAAPGEGATIYFTLGEQP